MRKFLTLSATVLLLAVMFSSCGKAPHERDKVPVQFGDMFTDIVETVLPEAEATGLAGAPAAIPLHLKPEASGTSVEENSSATIDYSNTEDGYIMVRFAADTDKALKVQVKGPATTYTYDIEPELWATFPLSDGNGSYTVSVYENISGAKYATVISRQFDVTLADEFAPFIRSNQYVDFEVAPRTISKAEELAGKTEDPLEKVASIYLFVVGNFSYDKELARTVKSGYLPVLDRVLENRKGICFDYAALMAGMLRSQGVATKLVIGYAGSEYHAWISVYSEKDGWIEGAIFFDGQSWKRLDPTFASGGKSSNEILRYIEDDKNYNSKYFY